MTDHHHVDEALISGYLDGELTQGQHQKVRIHLEDCASCAQLADELGRLQEVTMSTRFQTPADTQWDEQPRMASSRTARTLAWALAAVWALGLVIVIGWQVAQSSADDLVDALPVIGVWLVGGLLLLSVLLDRLKARKTDPYRNVKL